MSEEMRICERCGKPIKDGHIKKTAKLCRNCRDLARGNVIRKSVAPAIPIVEAYLKKHDYPITLRPLSVLDEHPELYCLFGMDVTDRRMLWVISNAIKLVKIPNGEVYYSPSRKRRRYFEKSTIDGDGNPVPVNTV